ncbi:304_t:CDS:2 [Acaulospora colombiana]|uniref:304_t:CDS:1 n=1 Tax=Acaulospora colombiana TaxID=27376 RepID=A0ACA9M939_9GLOM|nr:304_t:CDS:2 [Acaulospora colombiana]
MLTQKGDSLTEKEIRDLNIDPNLFDDDPDDASDKMPNKRIIKRIYNGEDVAVKKVEVENLNSQQMKIAKEANIIRLLSACQQIERFVGIYVKKEVETDSLKDYLFVVTEWMQNGNLHDYLRNNTLIPWKTKLKIAKQVATGLNFCRGVEVYHRDVRRWTAPEKIEYPKQPYTDKCEVYSFAILLWEISSHQLPFNEVDNPVKASINVVKGEHPSPFSKDTPIPYQELVEEAWQKDPKKRPTIDDIRKRLVKIENGETIFSSTKLADNNSEDTPLSRLLPLDQVILLHDRKRYPEAFPHFQQLAQQGDPVAAYYAGLYLYDGKYGIEKDEIKALQLFQKSADGNEPRGRYMYAKACLNGSYYSPEEGIKNLRKAALGNKNPDALYMVSQLFRNGEHGYEINMDKYKEYLEKAAAGGLKKAQDELNNFENFQERMDVD